MKKKGRLVTVAMAFIVVLLFEACDYYEPPELLLLEEDTSKNNTESTTELSEEDKITLYEVDGENIVKIQDYDISGELLDFQKDISKHQEIWSLIKKIIPPHHRSKLSQFLIYHGAKTKTSGYVDATINNLSKWQIAIAIDYAYRKDFNTDGELAFTIIHEFGHLMTLNNDQITAGVIRQNCDNFYVSNGCAKTEAYINTFHEQFWSDIWGEFSSLGETAEAKTSFYEKYENRFISKYAATNPSEDIAEVFATFVTKNDASAGISIREQKIQMMYDYPVLNELRDYIRHSSFVSKGVPFLPEGKRELKSRCLHSLR